MNYYLESKILDFFHHAYLTLLQLEGLHRLTWHVLNGFETKSFQTNDRLCTQSIRDEGNIMYQERPLKRKILRNKGGVGNIDPINELESGRIKGRSRQCPSWERREVGVIDSESFAINAVITPKAQ